MSAHTPGPWRAIPRFGDKIDVIHDGEAVGAASRTIARVTARETWLAEQEANARLIAAAPDLLAKVREFAAECAECKGTGINSRTVRAFGMDCDIEDSCPDCEDIRAVIEQAVGP